jgi:hypothetical protein
VLGKYLIAIMDQVTMSAFVPYDLSQLLQRPVSSGMGGHVHMREATPLMFDHNEYVKHPEGGRHRDEEVASDNRLRVIHRKRRPPLIAPRPARV